MSGMENKACGSLKKKDHFQMKWSKTVLQEGRIQTALWKLGRIWLIRTRKAGREVFQQEGSVKAA